MQKPMHGISLPPSGLFPKNCDITLGVMLPPSELCLQNVTYLRGVMLSVAKHLLFLAAQNKSRFFVPCGRSE
jgi:hypothetical protein